MLLSFKIENFRSIKDAVLLNFITEKRLQEENLPYNSFEESGFELLHSLVIYGRNAAGKSNLIKAFTAISYLIGNSDKRLLIRFPKGQPNGQTRRSRFAGTQNVVTCNLSAESCWFCGTPQHHQHH